MSNKLQKQVYRWLLNYLITDISKQNVMVSYFVYPFHVLFFSLVNEKTSNYFVLLSLSLDYGCLPISPLLI